MRFLGVCVMIAACCGTHSCRLPLDIMFLQDTTGSFVADLPNVLRHIPYITQKIDKIFPGSYFGVAEFQDKPYFPLGEPDSFCYKLVGPLSPDTIDFENAYAKLYASGGGDLPEDQYQAIINAALDPAVGWRPFKFAQDGSAAPDSIGGRIIIMSTDAVPHIVGDMKKLSHFPSVPQHLPPNTGNISTGDTTYECNHHDYPTPEQLRDVLKSTNTTLLILTPKDPRVAPVWRWVNEILLEQPSRFYRHVQNDSSDLHLEIADLLEGIALGCPEEVPEESTAANGDVSVPIVPAECKHCPCQSPQCDYCPPQCGGIELRFAKEPKRLQVLVNNE